MLIQFPDTVDLMGKHLHQIRFHIKKKGKKTYLHYVFFYFAGLMQLKFQGNTW